MYLPELILKRLSEDTLNNFAKYFGENFKGTRMGLKMGVISFLAKVVNTVNQKGSSENLLQILNEGGHTGDIFKNIEEFSAEPAKMRLLESIGGNITGYFFNQDRKDVVSNMSELAGINEKAASSMLNLSAPLTLGFLGEKVKDNNWDRIDLESFLIDESDYVYKELPPSLGRIINVSNQKTGRLSGELSYSETGNSSKKRQIWNFWILFPWLILLGSGFFLYFFMKKGKNYDKNENISYTIDQPSDTLHPEEMIIPFEDSLSRIADSDSSAAPIITQEKSAPEPEEVELPKPAETTQQTPVRNTGSTTPADKVPSGFSSVSSNSFSRNSAEITGQSSITPLLNQLVSSGGKVTINPLKSSGRLGEDRAYAIRDFLLENGVSLTQITIGKPVEGRNPSGVVYRVE